jgi:ABC-type polysaccharide/polyol phosphate transport system ATPase subunit
MDTPIKNYSSGMHARLGFSLAVNLNPMCSRGRGLGGRR